MPYEAEVNRSNPSVFLFLIDTSGSMIDPFSGGKRKAEGVSDAINRLLQNLAIKCSKSDGIRDYYEVGVLSYGKRVEPGFGGTLEGRTLVPISEVANSPARIEERTKKMDDGAGGVIEEGIKFPVWFDPKAAGATPMCEALKVAFTTLESWVGEHKFSFPPMVINITDGESTDGDPFAEAEALRGLTTQDGNVLLFNCHVSGTPGDAVLFAEAEEECPDQFAKMLFNMSSVLPDPIREAAERESFDVTKNSRGFGFNADLVELIRFLDIGTRPANLR
ncbi:MAG: vWA domain-containing protein [Planctomycetota bacterium]